ncbi:MAG: sigma-70 family RNA polymerase sigma factor [Bdellovibrionales bacterium]|nr:sigma-70 family RNA polymerase sigma factor [Bdellovibrionales bacterium]
MTVSPPEDSDETLMGRYLDGDVQAFDLLYRRHAGRVRSLLLRKLARPEEADDVTQKVFLKFHTAREQYDASYRVVQWLFVIARTALVDHLRAQGRNPVRLSDDGEMPEGRVDPGQDALQASTGEAEAWLERLPNEAREVVRLRVIEEHTYEEIAERLGKSEAGVRQTLSRALRRLKSRGLARGES